jgi:structure-specific endonuclease subunit SLX1
MKKAVKTVKPGFVYILEHATTKATYVGATVDLDRRLRQHNKEIKGGAHATGARTNEWRRICYATGFPDWSSTLQFEWRLKQLTRNIDQYPNPITTADTNSVYIGYPMTRRLRALEVLLLLDRPTSKSIPYELWTPDLRVTPPPPSPPPPSLSTNPFIARIQEINEQKLNNNLPGPIIIFA